MYGITRIMKYYIKHNKEKCIGCGACAAMDSGDWEMKDDGKAHLVGVKGETKEFSEKDLSSKKETAEACPVNAIYIYQDKKKIV